MAPLAALEWTVAIELLLAWLVVGGGASRRATAEILWLIVALNLLSHPLAVTWWWSGPQSVPRALTIEVTVTAFESVGLALFTRLPYPRALGIAVLGNSLSGSLSIF